MNITFETPYDRRRAYEEKNRERRRESKKRDRIKRTRPSEKNPERGMFIAWDGEGYTTDDGKHHYALLASSVGDCLIAPEGRSLSRDEVFDAFLNSRIKYPTGINVFYGGNYDFNMILRSNGLPRFYTNRLRKGYRVWLGEYQVKWIENKMLTISRDGVSITLYDVLPFFQRSFVNACDEYLGKEYDDRNFIVGMKKQRDSFTYDDIQEVIAYNNAELKTLVLLMNELRNRLDSAHMPIGKWYGPGSIAAQLMKRHKIKDAMRETYFTDPEVSRAAQFAYAGGRFEIVKCGHVDAPAYEYDINSAYPYAMTKLPNLKKGKWRYVSGDPGYCDFALYHVQSDGSHLDSEATLYPHPLWARTQAGVVYPHTGVKGWYWTPDVECLRHSSHSYTVLEAWVYEPDTDEKPFSFVAELYAERQALKKAGNGAHVGIKLGLNSLYGKMAQQVGWSANPDGPILPPFHQLEWAGYVTSHCRAMLWDAMRDNLDAVIATETDALFSTRELPLSLGTDLGQWERTVFSSLSYCNSGVYWGTLDDGTEVQKSRGFPPSAITREMMLEAMGNDERMITVPVTSFISAGKAWHSNYWTWCRWITADRDIATFPEDPSQKRTHLVGSCRACIPGDREKGTHQTFTLGSWHDTFCEYAMFGQINSLKFPIQWIDGPNPPIEGEDESEW